MVVFTCNHCGDSLQKPKVEKHYSFACRTVKSLTCVDCFKDFRGEEYATHTKCLTEEERYAAKGSIPNGIVKKGEVKQESWIEMIKSIIDQETSLKPSVKNLLETISSYNNVPRKKPKFFNFIKSSSGGRVNMNDVEAVWTVIENYKNKGKPKEEISQNTEKTVEDQQNGEENVVENKKAKKKKIDDLDESNDAKKQKLEENEESKDGLDTSSKKSKKKKKLVEDLDNKVEENGQDTEENDVSSKKSKKKKIDEDVVNKVEDNGQETEENDVSSKKSKKKKIAEDVVNKVEENGQETEENDVSSKKSKKKKKIAEDVVNKVEENGQETEETEPVKTKKKKDRHTEADAQKEQENVENGKNVEDISSKKSKKKKKSSEEQIETNVEEKQNGMDTLDQMEEKNSTEEEFDFAENIINVLKSKDSMRFRKLEKKVIKLYLKQSGSSLEVPDCIPKIRQKFHKKIRTLNVSVVGDVVSLTNK